MDLLKVFFVILIAFTCHCQVLAKPSRNQKREKARKVPAKNMEQQSMVPMELPQGLKMNMIGRQGFRRSRN